MAVQYFDLSPTQSSASMIGHALGNGLAKNFIPPEQLVQRNQLQQGFFLVELEEKFIELNLQKQKAIQLQQELMLIINSQKDPAYVELTLKRVLGVVSKSEKKVFFSRDYSHHD